MQRLVSELKGVGGKTESVLESMGIVNLYDLIRYYPRGYENFRGLITLAEAELQQMNYVRVKIVSAPKMQYYNKMAAFHFYAVDEKGRRIRVTYFRQPYLIKAMTSGRVMVLKGRITFRNGEPNMVNPEILTEQELEELEKIPITAKYTVKKGISEKKLKNFLQQAFLLLQPEYSDKDYISPEIRNKYGLKQWLDSYYKMHFPQTKEEIAESKKRLIFDEFYFFQTNFSKKQMQVPNSFRLQKTEKMQRFIDALPFSLTPDQTQAIADSLQDMKGRYRMSRLIQGDVGSGKTAVAFALATAMTENGFQVAFMAPTEVLARQHYLDAQDKLSSLGINTTLLLGSTSAKEKKQIYRQMEEGEVDVIIGTHALFQEKATYRNLGLVITDEQHRFGVMQRERLSQKSGQADEQTGEQALPHVLVMSATPIPRTLALILYQDMDISMIKSMPTDRIPIQSFLRSGEARQKIYRFIEKEIKTGAAAYIVCPAVEENEEMELAGVIEYTQELQKQFPHIKMACIYGEMPDKEKIMQSFAEGELEVLISTTVIEVGVNVPRATVMLVENAERFGLAQLHQLRGRVGRGNRQSYCIFLSDAKNKEIRGKLEFVATHTSGFDIAEYDLKMRGPGDAFGIKQHGLPALQLADLYHDLPILELVRKATPEIMDTAFREDLLELYYHGSRKIMSL